MSDFDEMEMTDAVRAIAKALHWLGTADAATRMGALELLASEVKDGNSMRYNGMSMLAEELEKASERIEGGLMAIAAALKSRK